MPLPGGPADKVGNRYERRWVVRSMLDLLAGVAESLRIEVPGQAGSGAEFRLMAGNRACWYQVKRQKDGGAWTIASMASEGFLQAWLPKLRSGDRCVFGSGTSADELREICQRSEDASSWPEFDEEFLASDVQRVRFGRLRALWGDIEGREVFELLHLIEVRTIDEELLSELVALRIGGLIVGDPDTVGDVLGQLADDRIHKELRAVDVWDHLSVRGFAPTDQARTAAEEAEALVAGPVQSTAVTSQMRLDERLGLLPPLHHRRISEAWSDYPDLTWRLVSTLTGSGARPTATVQEWELNPPGWLANAPWQVQTAAADLAVAYGGRRLGATLFLGAASDGAVRRDYWVARAALLLDELDDLPARDNAIATYEALSASDDYFARAVAALIADDLSEAADQLERWTPDDPIDLAVRWSVALRLTAPRDSVLSEQIINAALAVTGDALAQRWLGGQAIARTRLLIARVRMGLSPSVVHDLTAARDSALRARDDRRSWRGDSTEPTELACHAALLANDLPDVIRIGTPGPDGATPNEARSSTVSEYVAVAASQLGHLELARDAARNVADPFGSARVEAVIAEASGADSKPHWTRAVSLAGDSDENLASALVGLASVGVTELPRLGELAARHPEAAEEVRAIAELAAGEAGAAIARLRGMRKSSITAALTLARAYQNVGKTDEHVATLRDAAHDFHDPTLRFSAALAFAEANRRTEAEREIQYLLAVNDLAAPVRADVLRLGAQLALSDDDLLRGAEFGQAALQLQPADSNTRWSVIHVLMRRHDFEEAWRTVSAAPQPLQPTTPTQAQMQIELHRRFGTAAQTVSVCLGALRLFGSSEQVSAFALFTLLVSRHPLAPQELAELHGQMERFFELWPNSRFLHRIRWSTPEELLARMVEDVTPTEEQIAAQRHLIREVRSGRAPLGMLAAYAGKSYAEVAILRGVGVIMARNDDRPDMSACQIAVQVAADHDVAIGIDTLVVLLTLPADVRAAAMTHFSRLLMPDEALFDVHAASDRLGMRSTGTWYYDVHLRAARMAELPADEADRLAAEAADLKTLAESLTRLPRPNNRTFPGIEDDRFDSWTSVLDVAHDLHVPVWIDDVALRAVARHAGLLAFSTPALIDHLVQSQNISGDQHESALRAMIKGRVGDMGLSERRFMEIAEDERWSAASVAAAFSRPTAWREPRRAAAFYERLFSLVRTHRPQEAANWLYAAVCGAAGATTDVIAAKSLAAGLLAHTIDQSGAHGRRAASLVEVARRGLADLSDIEGSQSDPLVPAARMLRDLYAKDMTPDIATSHVMATFSALDDKDRIRVAAVLLA